MKQIKNAPFHACNETSPYAVKCLFLTILELMDVNFEEYGKIMNFSAKNGTLYWLRDNKLLIDSCKCQSCGSIMQLKKKASVLDGKVWRCATTVSCVKLLFFSTQFRFAFLVYL